METYSHIVPLGRRCATTHHLRRFFNHGEGYPFDWWITPVEGLLQVLERPDVDWLYDPAVLRLTDERRSVMHAPTSILFHHEFPRDQDAQRDPGVGPPVQEDFREHLAIPRARTAKLLDKLLALDAPGNRILFVREIGERGKLAAALAIRFSRADWTLKVIPRVNSPGFTPAHPALRWQGDPVVWDRALGKLDVRLDNPSLKPFSEVRPGSESQRRSAD